MTQENKVEHKKISKKTKLPITTLATVALVGATGCFFYNISSIDNVNITIEELSEGEFNKKKALKDYSNIINGRLPKHAVIDEETTIDNLCQLYNDSNISSGILILENLIYFKGEDYFIKVSLTDEFPSTNPSHNIHHVASIEFTDSTGMVVEKLSGSFNYMSSNEIRELSEQYKNHPKVLSAIEKK